MTTTTNPVAVMAIGKGLVHAATRSANGEGWGSVCSSRWIGGDFDVVVETLSHVNCSRCLKKLGREELH